MKCLKCGADLEKDAKFCVVCGTSVEAAEEKTEVSSEKAEEKEVKKELKKEVEVLKSFSKAQLIKLIVGTIIILIGFVRIVSAGTTISTTSFGADFYTYTYQGIVAVSEILASIDKGLGWVVVSIGALIDVSALKN